MLRARDDSLPPQPFHRFLFWRIAVVITLPLLVVVLGTAVVLTNFNPNRYGPALVSALEQITGRPVTLNGPVTVRWSLTPAIQASDLTIANPPGFAAPNVITLAGLRAEIALIPLFSHHVDILKLVLLQPHLTLERLPSGEADWDFARATAHSDNTMPFLDSRTKIALEAVEVKDGLLTIHAGSQTSSIHFTKLIGTADSLSSPLNLNALAEIGATSLTITGTVGPIERFSGIGSGPWPLHLQFTLGNAHLDIDGLVRHPGNARGYDLALNLTIPDLSVLGQAFPPSLLGRANFPAIQNVTASARISDGGAAFPNVSSLTVAAGQSDLSALEPGLALNTLNLTMPSLDQPFTLLATGTSGSGNFSLQGHFGAMQSLLDPVIQSGGIITPPASFPVALIGQIGNATATVSGAIATPQTLSGTALALTANIPDLSALSAIAGMGLPAWKHIIVQTSITDPGGAGLYNAAEFDGIVLTMDNASLGGDATLSFAPQPKLQLALNVTQANLDALLAALPPSPELVAAPSPDGSTIIPDVPLPLGFLSWGNADVQLAADNIVWNGASFTALQANAQLAGGKLTISPLTGEIPGGDVTANASLDASVTPPAETLSINAPALALGPLVKLLNLTGPTEGNIQLQFSSVSVGSTLHAMAANLSGQLGLASVNAKIRGNLLDNFLGPLETAAGLPSFGNAPVSIRCFGLFIDANKGVAAVKTLGLDSGQMVLQGAGTIDLGQETYDVAMQPFEGQPVQLSGNFVQPSWTATPQPIGPTPMPAAAGATPAQPDICPATLALARFGQPGPAAPPQTNKTPNPSPPQSIAAPNTPKNLLNSLLNP